MAPARAEVALVQLKNCLVNLPPSLVTVLQNANTVRHVSKGTVTLSDYYSPVPGCPKCCRRAPVSVSDTSFWGRFKRRRSKVDLCGMDRNAQQIDT